MALERPAPVRACRIEGARTHNLKGITCEIPFGRLTAITGVSGSGKSSLAFDTLYAEGQRRFVDCLSTYARQFLPRLDRPDADRIGEIQPAVALEQKVSIRNARSTVGTITETSDHLSLLFAHGGTLHCGHCDGETEQLTIDAAVERVRALATDVRWLLVAPVSGARVDLDWLRERGYHRFWIGGRIVEEASSERPLRVVVDRFTTKGLARSRAAESIESAWRLSDGLAEVLAGPSPPTKEPHSGLGSGALEGLEAPDVLRSPALALVRGHSCPACGARARTPKPPDFSPNSALGACDACQGFGRVITVDRDKVIPDRTKTLRNHAVLPFATATGSALQEKLLTRASTLGIPTGVPFSDLPAEQQEWVFRGDKQYPGVEGLFRTLERKRYKPHVRIFLARFRGYVTCPDCGGSRRRRDAARTRVGGLSIHDVEQLPIERLRPWLTGLTLTPSRQAAVASVRAEIDARLAYLENVGLGYLTLGRPARTLSGGETQRIRLASGLGSALTDTLYVLDEPTVGLHALDTARMLSVLCALCARGNTVVTVEHDPGIIEGADHLVVLGPGGGARGGEIVFEGTVADFARRDPGYFRTDPTERKPLAPVSSRTPALVLEGVRCHNVSIERLRIPLDRLVVITGVSGSGKSTLLDDVVFRNAQRWFGRTTEEVGAIDRLDGLAELEDVLFISQAPLGRSSRSNIATYAGFYSTMRTLLARTPRAQALRLGPGAFSFNRPGGRCETCEGMGTTTLEMHFLADVEIACDVCRGQRFQEHVLSVTWKGLDIARMLELTVEEALNFFADQPSAGSTLSPLVEVGLDYARLGQSTSTLSGGEAQRLEIASLLATGRTPKRRLYLLDEPTSGLHARDISRLLAALRRLVSRGNGVIVVEHQLDFIAAADHAIDLGPGGGDRGGRIVYEGPVSDLLRAKASLTGKALRER